MRSLPLRALEGALLLFGLYALFTVPLGRKTGARHLMAIFTSPAALEAARAVRGEVTRAAQRGADRRESGRALGGGGAGGRRGAAER